MNIRSRLDSHGAADYHTHDKEVIESSFVHLTESEMLTKQDVKSVMQYSSLKSCVLDPMPSTLVSRCDVLLPVLARLINTSLKSGQFPVAWKEALVLPLLKKPGLDILFKNFHPVSNLPLGGPLRRLFTYLSQAASIIATACSMACQPTSLISCRGSKMLQLG